MPKINFEAIKRATKYRLQQVNVEEIVNAEFVRKLRNTLNMSTNVFASAMGVNRKTVEKWEKCNRKITGVNARLLYALSKDKRIIEHWYLFGKVNNDTGEVESFYK